MAITITGAMNTTAGDITKAHANLLPTHLLMCNVCYKAALRLAAMPKSHPLYHQVRYAAKTYVQKHKSPLHQLFYTAGVDPTDDPIKQITPTQRKLHYRPSFNTHMAESREEACDLAIQQDDRLPIKVYCDGSGYEGGIGAAAVLYKGDRVHKTLRYYLGASEDHMVYEAEIVGVMLAFHLLTELATTTVFGNLPLLIGLDNQATIQALGNQRAHPGAYLLDQVHGLAERTQSRQDTLRKARTRRNKGQREENVRKARTRGVCDVEIRWVPGHEGFAPNEKADKEAKKAAQKHTSRKERLPTYLRCGPLPASIAARKQKQLKRLKLQWQKDWKQLK